MNLKLRSQKAINLNKEVALQKTFFFLQKDNYNILETTNSLILFDDKIASWKLVSNTSYYSKIDAGRVEFVENNGFVDVCLSYSVSITFEILQLFLIVLASIYIDYRVLLLSAIFILNFIFKIQNIQNNFINECVSS